MYVFSVLEAPLNALTINRTTFNALAFVTVLIVVFVFFHHSGYGNKLKSVAEKINERNKRFKSIAEKWKDYGDGDSKSSDVCCLQRLFFK